MARLRAQRSLFELEGSELAFSEQEIVALFDRIYRLEIDPLALKRLHEITRGWGFALVHLAKHFTLREPESHPSELERSLRDKRLSSLDECFAREVLDLEAEDIHGLTLLSVFSSLSPGLVSHILDPSGAGLLHERLAECYFLR